MILLEVGNHRSQIGNPIFNVGIAICPQEEMILLEVGNRRSQIGNPIFNVGFAICSLQ
jgi:hypothetical protein